MPTLDADARRKIGTTVTVSSGADLTGATVQLEVDNVRWPMSWTSTGAAPLLSRTAETSGCATGPDATPAGGDLDLTVGRHVAKVVVTLADGQVIPGATAIIDVRGS